MNKFLSIQDAAKYMGVSPQTLRRWEKAGKIKPAYRTEGNQKRYDPSLLRSLDLTTFALTDMFDILIHPLCFFCHPVLPRLP